MSEPVIPDWVIIKSGDGATPTEVFSIKCGFNDVTVNTGANTTDRFIRDCAAPGAVPIRRLKVTGKQMDVSASGFIDKAQIAQNNTAIGTIGNYKLEYYTAGPTDAGTLYGAYSGSYALTSFNQSTPLGEIATAEINLSNNGPWTWTPAP